jgi:hypothetical protein
VNVSVPRYAEFKNTATLSCYFELDGGRLYSVKWYKDDYEFFSYSPHFKHKVFNLPGITVDVRILAIFH